MILFHSKKYLYPRLIPLLMLSDKEVKEEFRKKTAKNPEEFYAVNKLREFGFKRYRCKKCGRFFWSTQPREFCGDASCSGGFRFINDTPARNKLSYTEVWQEFSRLFKEQGYTPIKRYPVAARWRDDTDFVQASIYDFQPYVVSGEIEPPANPLVVPQFSLRFNDVDNVGLTGSHFTGFVMIGQHAFKKPSEYDQEKYFEDIHNWLVKGLKIPVEEIIYHEDAWAGGGNAGVCMEFFSRGLELGNQVYMTHQVTESGIKPLKLKVLDMGLGQERNAWFSQATPTAYDATFPKVMKKLYEISGVEFDSEIMRSFLPFASLLNADENPDLEKSWRFIASKLGVDVETLKKKVLRYAALYSIAEHSRSLLVALSDGVLPSNVGGGYNLRMIFRRALSFIKKYDWSIRLEDVMEWHALELKPLFPELSENLEEIKRIVEVETKKYEQTMKNARSIVIRLLKKNNSIPVEKLVELYDSHGINPNLVVEVGSELGINVEVPDNFYALLTERHSKNKKSVQKTSTKKEEKIDFKTQERTKALYFDDYKLVNFKARVLEIKNVNNKFFVVLDKTAFYPTSGGQMHDVGFLNNNRVIDVFKQDYLIVHVLDKIDFKEGDLVEGSIDFDVRKQLTQHHTATHIINGASRFVLGNHVWQSGASKTVERARLDITHYEQLSDSEIRRIEEKANEIVRKKLPVKKYFLKRNVAEARFGFRLYQGGAVPGKELRIVEIPNFDVEACGGTHLDNTGEVELIKILKTTKIQDGVLRIEFVAGDAAKRFVKEQEGVVEELSKLLDCDKNQIPSRVKELFEKWKLIVKKKKLKEFRLESNEEFKGFKDSGIDAFVIVKEAARILKTQPEFVVKTVKRFLNDIEKVLNS